MFPVWVVAIIEVRELTDLFQHASPEIRREGPNPCRDDEQAPYKGSAKPIVQVSQHFRIRQTWPRVHCLLPPISSRYVTATLALFAAVNRAVASSIKTRNHDLTYAAWSRRGSLAISRSA